MVNLHLTLFGGICGPTQRTGTPDGTKHLFVGGYGLMDSCPLGDKNKEKWAWGRSVLLCYLLMLTELGEVLGADRAC